MTPSHLRRGAKSKQNLVIVYIMKHTILVEQLSENAAWNKIKKTDALAPLACLSPVYINHTILDIFSKADKNSDFSTFFEIYGIGGCWK